jgi:hypothetical protein
MTIKFKEPDIFDKILQTCNKKRAYKAPGRSGPYTYNTIQPESFLRALFRPADVSPPAGWFYRDDIVGDNSILNTKGKSDESKKQK